MSVCLSVCMSVCLSVCPSVQAITFELLHIDFIFGIWVKLEYQGHWVKVMSEENDNFTYFNMLILYIWLQVIIKVKVTHQGEGHIKVKVKISTSFPILWHILLISTHYSSACGYKSLTRSSSYTKVKVTSKSRSLQAGGLHSTESVLVLN